MGIRNEEKIRQVIETQVLMDELRLVELDVKPLHKRLLVRVYVDTEKGVTIDQCTRLSRSIEATLESEQLMDSAYTLEVSSPGIERPIREAWQFRKNIGRELDIDYTAAGGGRTRVAAKLTVVDGEWLVLEPVAKGRKTTEEIRIPMDQIQQAVIKMRW